MATTVTLKPNAIDLSGSTSGTTTLQASAVAGTTTVTLPAATDTLVGKATTDTLTNKTLTSPTMTAPVLGTPASGTVTNLTGTASININGTVGATTATTGAFTTLSASGGTSLATSSGTVGVGGAAGAQTLTVSKTSLTNPITIGAVSDSNAYGQLSFNGVFTAAGVLGINAGADANLYLSAPTGGTVQQKINNVKISEVSSTGLAVTGTLSATGLLDLSAATAGQIKFPATQNASSDANTLDDYEESTWTPTLAFGGASVGITYAANYNTASVTKIGSRVFVSGITILTSKGSSTGNASLTSLPFPADGIKAFSAVACSLTGVTFTGQYSMELDANADVVYFYQVSNLGVQSNLTNTNFANGSAFIFSFSYYTT